MQPDNNQGATMKPADLFEFYGNKKNTYLQLDRLGIYRQLVFNWIKIGSIPRDKQLLLEQVTGGQLKADTHLLYHKRKERKNQTKSTIKESKNHES